MMRQLASHFSARTLFFNLIVLLLTLCVSGAVHAQGTTIATVISFKGSLQVRPANAANFKTVAAQQQLHAGDLVKTAPGGGASLLFSDGTQVDVGPAAQLKITAPTPVRGNTSFFQLVVGEVWARLRPGRAAQTKYANLVVRGTEVNLIVDEEQTKLNVAVGRVAFFNDLGTVDVNAGQSSTAREGQAPTAPVTFANPGLTVEWRLDLNRVQLARDNYLGAPYRGPAIPVVKTPVQGALDEFREYRFESVLQALAQVDFNALKARPDELAVAARVLAETNLRLGNVDAANAAITDSIGAVAARPMAQAYLLNGQAWIALETGKTADAVAKARQSLGAVTDNGEAHLILGHAALRQNDRVGAKAEWEKVQKTQDSPTSYLPHAYAQAQSWLGLLSLENDQTGAATEHVRMALGTDSQSAVAHMAASLVALGSNDTKAAVAQAKLSVTINSESAGGQLALASAELARGNMDAAGAAAAKATALDPGFAEAHYILGLADAGRRDYGHAERSLRQALELSPDYAPAAAALGRTLVRAGKPKEGLAFLTEWSKGKEGTPSVTAATGEAMFRLARYDQALEQYRKAVKDDGNSALAWSGLCRAALDANSLLEAIKAGMQAVALKPNVAEYHAHLGLAYRFSHLDGQADREFRTALNLDPNNALALVQLGQIQKDTNPLLTQRNGALLAAQGFLLDPSISRDLLRGGTSGFVEPIVGDQQGVSGAFRATADSGNVNLYGQGYDVQTNSYRPDSDDQLITQRLDVTVKPDRNSNLLLGLGHQREDYGVPGAESTRRANDDRSIDHNDNGMAAVRRQMGDGVVLWAGLFRGVDKQERSNPGFDFSSRVQLGLTTPIVPESDSEGRSLVPEVRLDVSGERLGMGGGQWSLGYARPQVRDRLSADLFLPGFLGLPPRRGVVTRQQEIVSNLLYAQYSRNVNSHLQFSGQLRRESIERDTKQTGTFIQFFPINLDPPAQDDGHWLPSATINYRPAERFNLRLQASRRVTDDAGSILAPVDTLVFTEPSALPSGFVDPSSDGSLTNFQLDLEHYTKSGSLFKAFLFHSSAEDFVYDFSQYANTTSRQVGFYLEQNFLHFDTLRRTGIGMRHERRFARSLFSQTGVTYAKTDATAQVWQGSGLFGPAPFSGQAAPYHPNLTAYASVSYISDSGNKVILTGNFRGKFYQDNQQPGATERPTFPASATFDLLLTREPTVFNEVFLQVKNIFGAQQIVYNGIRYQPRQFVVGWTRRF